MNRSLPRSAFAAAVVLVALPFLTPCGSISIPLKIVTNVGSAVVGKPKAPGHSGGRNAIAETPPLRVVQHSAISRSSLISDAEAAGGKRKKAMSSLQSAATTAANVTLLAACMVDPMIGGMDGVDMDLSVDSIGRPQIRRGNLVVMTSPHVEVQGYDIIVWSDKKAACGISRARVNAGAKVLVLEGAGHEYFALADRIHYHAQRHELILEGVITIRCGGQTITSEKSGLARLDVNKRTLHMAGACRIATSPNHFIPIVPATP